MDKFSQLLEDLCTGKLSHNHIQIAYRAMLKRDKRLKGFGDILGGVADDNAGIIFKMFQCIDQTIGSMELAFRRGYQYGYEDAKKGKKYQEHPTEDSQ